MKITWPDDPKQLANAWRTVERENSHRILMNKVFRRLYFDLPDTAYIDSSLPYREWTGYRTLQQCAYNITRMVIDSVAPSVCKRMRIVVQPVGADYKTERTCKDLGAAIAGIMDETKYWDVAAPIAYRDGSASDLGSVLWYVDGGGEIRCCNITPNCVRFHFDEGQDPLHIYYEMVVPRSGLAAQYEAHAAEIAGLPEYRPETVVGVEYPGTRGGDCVQLVMAYRRAANGKPGKKVVMGLGGGNPVLDSGEWKYDFFPSAHWRYDWDSQGFGGYAGARVLTPYHVQSDRLLQAAYDGLEGAVPTVLANELERDDMELSTTAWRKVYWKTHKPEVFIPKTVSDQVLAEIDKLKETAFFAYGQSMQAAQGLRPQGLNSAPAQREWRDIKNERLGRLIDNYAMMATDSGRIIVALATDAYKNKKVLASAPGTDAFREIDWPKDLREDKYKITFTKSSDVPDTVAGRVEFFGELRDRGAIDEVQYIRGINVSDLKSTTDRLAATADYVEMQIAKALDDGEFVMPDGMQGPGLDMGVTVGTQEYQRVQASGKNYPRKNLECLRRYIQACDARRKGLTAKPPVMPVPATFPGQPAGVQPMPSSVLPPAMPLVGGNPAPVIGPTGAMPAGPPLTPEVPFAPAEPPPAP
jgi:hypothetical protein